MCVKCAAPCIQRNSSLVWVGDFHAGEQGFGFRSVYSVWCNAMARGSQDAGTQGVLNIPHHVIFVWTVFCFALSTFIPVSSSSLLLLTKHAVVI